MGWDGFRVGAHLTAEWLLEENGETDEMVALQQNLRNIDITREPGTGSGCFGNWGEINLRQQKEAGGAAAAGAAAASWRREQKFKNPPTFLLQNLKAVCILIYAN